MRSAAFRHLVTVSVLGLLVTGAFLAKAAAAEPLASFAAVRALTQAQAAKAVPVRIEATVLGTDPGSPWSLFLHDGTAGCYVKLVPGAELPKLLPGRRVLIEGVSMSLGYFPSVARARAHDLGQGVAPPAIPLAAHQIFLPEFDSAWVEVPALVLSYEARDQRLTLDLEVHGLPFKAELPLEDHADERIATLMQRPVRLRGVLGTIFNQQRQMTDRHFFLSSLAAIVPATLPTTATAPPLLQISAMLTGEYGPQTPIRVAGIVTQSAAKGFYLRDKTGSTLVVAAPGYRFAPGTHVEAEGFASVAPFRPVLRAASVTVRTVDAPPPPVRFAESRVDLPAMHAELVTLEGTYLARQEGRAEVILECQAGQHVFEVLVPVGRAPLPDLVLGDRLGFTGICELTTTHALPRIGWVDGFRVHLPGPEGLTILHRAPWWTARRLLVALGVSSALAMLGLVGTWVFRQRVRRQMAIIGDRLRAEAVGKERDRIARDLHDTLEQQLSGVALQLDGLDDVVRSNPPAAAKVLSVARRMLRYTRLEAHRSVWDLRSKILEEQGLVAALRDMAEASSGPVGPKISVRLAGEVRRLSATTEFHLFRIAQEALANAIKHSGARAVLLSLSYSAGDLQLSVQDDGQGFAPDAPRAHPGPHFGLLGMRERAEKIGAILAFKTQPGAGCTVAITIAVAPSPSPILT